MHKVRTSVAIPSNNGGSSCPAGSPASSSLFFERPNKGGEGVQGVLGSAQMDVAGEQPN